jgi:hypothetical protein
MDFRRIGQGYFGYFSRIYFKRVLLPFTLFAFFGLLIFSAILFPGEYKITSHTISDLGNPKLNPFPGWLIFSMAFWTLSLLSPPLFLYLHWRLVKMHKFEATLGTVFNFIAIFGMILLGIFPNLPETDLMHIIAAILSFVGLTTALIFYWGAVIHDSLQKALKYHQVGIFMILIIITVLLASILFLGIVQISSDYFFEEIYWYLDFPFWEWIIFIIISFQLLFIGLIIPDQFPT